MLYTITVSSLLLICNTVAAHHYSKRISRPSENAIDNNPPDSSGISVSASSYGAPFSNHRDSYPAPFSKHHAPHPRPAQHAHINQRLRKDQLSLDDKADFTAGSSVGYILTAAGREKIYDGQGETKIAPHAAPFASSPYAKKFAYDKALKKYRLAYSSLAANSPIVVDSSTPTAQVSDDPPDGAVGTAAPDAAVSRTFNTATPNSATARHKFYPDKTDSYKGTVWKQLGPNVEISSAAEHVPFTRQIGPKERGKKASSQPRKNGPKNLRTGYMTTQQHALYVANNVKGFKGGAFDHSNVLRQSDKFELTDAMVGEAEKEEALKSTMRVRFHQDPHSPFHTAQPYDAAPQSAQYYSPANAPLSLAHASLAPSAFASMGALGRGFVRHIEIEMNGAGGARKMVPALIIPLAEAAAANYVGAEVTAPALHPDRHVKPAFPYDIVAPRYPDGVNIASTADNYQVQPFAQLHYQYKSQLTDDPSYNPYASPYYHNHNYNTRFAYINSNNGGGAVTTAPSSGEAASVGTTAAAHDKRSGRFSTSHSSAHSHHAAKKTAQHLAAEQSEQRPVTAPPSVTSIATFIYDANNAAAGTAHSYLAPSESSYFATMASTRDEKRPGRPFGTKQFEKNDVRRDK